MKKLLTLLFTAMLAVACCFGFTACGEKSDVKIGLICLHGETSTYDKNFIDAMKKACEVKGADLVIKTDIPEDEKCYEAAIDLVSQGCQAIFADSFGHEPHILKAAKEKPNVQFYHATGTTAHTENVANFHNAFANIYQGRYVAGYAAGMKLAEMVKDKTETAYKVGYVGAFPYAEVKSGYTSWFLGLRAAFGKYAEGKTVTMEVKFTNSWYNETSEKEAANALIQSGCLLISQHADSWGAPTACEDAGVPNVSYNGSTISKCPKTFIISSRINWQPYYELIIDAVRDSKKAVPADWTSGFGSLYTAKEGSVCVTELGNAAAEGTAEALDKLVYDIKYNGLKVFDCDTFTVTKNDKKNVNATVDENGKLLQYKADVNTDAEFAADTEVVKEIKNEKGEVIGRYFAESEFRSAPYFDIDIDGIIIK